MSSTSRIMAGSFDVAGGGGGGGDFGPASVAVARHLIEATACREHLQVWDEHFKVLKINSVRTVLVEKMNAIRSDNGSLKGILSEKNTEQFTTRTAMPQMLGIRDAESARNFGRVCVRLPVAAD